MKPYMGDDEDDDDMDPQSENVVSNQNVAQAGRPQMSLSSVLAAQIRSHGKYDDDDEDNMNDNDNEESRDHIAPLPASHSGKKAPARMDQEQEEEDNEDDGLFSSNSSEDPYSLFARPSSMRISKV